MGAVGAYPVDAECAFEVRAFVPAVGVGEDPVTGSLNASLAQWLIGSGQAPNHYTASQGTALGRSGRIEITAEAGTIWVGGAATVLFSGTAVV